MSAFIILKKLNVNEEIGNFISLWNVKCNSDKCLGMKRSLKIGILIASLCLVLMTIPFYVLIGIDYFHQDLEDDRSAIRCGSSSFRSYGSSYRSGSSFHFPPKIIEHYGWYGFDGYFDNCTMTSYKKDYLDWKIL